jgi:hypothetical protein
MTRSEQIKAIAADFLRALATVPGLFTRWQAESCPNARGAMVRDQLGLSHTPSAADLTRMAEYAQPALNGTGPLHETPNICAFAHSSEVPMMIAVAHRSEMPMMIAVAHQAVPA